MSFITVFIQDPAGSSKIPIELPDDIPVKHIVPALAIMLKLPYPTQIKTWFEEFWEFASKCEPMPIGYILDHKQTGRRLRPDDTLSGLGVKEGDVLILLPYAIGGTPNIEEWSILISGKRFSDVAVVIALQLGDVITALILPRKLSLASLRTYISYQLSSREQAHLVSIVQHGAFWNRTTNTRINSIEGMVSDVINSGDWIIVKIPDESSLDNEQDQEILTKIKIYPSDSNMNSESR